MMNDVNDCKQCTCVIPDGQRTGWCERHHVKKTAPWVKLCQTRPDYFRLWEEGRGPGQRHAAPAPSMPPTITMAWNLTKAIASFVAAGCKTVDAGEYQRRLEICEQCTPPGGYRVGNRCSHQGCGCFLSVKAKGRAWTCPDGRWNH